jgi:lipopolysaccharide transport system ATP-binding protein
MNDIAIRVENLGKQYRIGKRERYKTLRDTLADTATAPFRWLRHCSSTNGSGAPDHIWALKDVSFEIPHGEVVGIIGRNGAGKSTLLKVLSRITEPTEGEAEIHGRVGSLLEVGTGFHAELTGRENIYLNGAILGMPKAEIARKFDEIVAFAEIEKFLDTPVKHYSSGMYMRLAFAVAAHLEPDVIVVDEVLAVGDAAFQKKCLGKMGEAAKGGRTVIFVSHQLNQIRRLCERCIWLDAGSVRSVGPTYSVVSAYEAAMSSPAAGCGPRENTNSQKFRFTKWEISSPRASEPNVVATRGPIDVKFSVEVRRSLSACFLGIALYNSQRQLLWGNGVGHLDLPAGNHDLVYTFDSLPLQPGVYQWLVTLYDETGLLDEWNCQPEMLIGTEPLNHAHDDWTGVLNVAWNLRVSPRQVHEQTDRVQVCAVS